MKPIFYIKEEFWQNRELQNCVYQVKEHGFWRITTDLAIVKVFSSELAHILTNDKITVKTNTKEEIIICGHDFIKSYVSGFIEGESFFLANYKLDPNVLYGGKTQEYIRNLHNNYFHSDAKHTKKGWKYWIDNYPTIINNSIIEEYGYYAGIINQLQILSGKHPKLFVDFEKCEHEIKNKGNKKLNLKSDRKQPETLYDIWSDKKKAEMINEVSKLVGKYINKTDNQTYLWKGKKWKNMAAITEIWKDKELLKIGYLKFGNQRQLCKLVCNYFGITDESKVNSIYNAAFKESIIAIDSSLNDGIINLKQKIELELKN